MRDASLAPLKAGNCLLDLQYTLNIPSWTDGHNVDAYGFIDSQIPCSPNRSLCMMVHHPEYIHSSLAARRLSAVASRLTHTQCSGLPLGIIYLPGLQTYLCTLHDRTSLPGALLSTSRSGRPPLPSLRVLVHLHSRILSMVPLELTWLQQFVLRGTGYSRLAHARSIPLNVTASSLYASKVTKPSCYSE